MHDLYEGIHRYNMGCIINKLILEGHFTLEHLNSRIKYFNYDLCEKNVPPPIKCKHLKNGYIICSAAEMLCLVRNFRFIVGDLVPKENLTWSFYLVLLEITDLLTSLKITKQSLTLLKTLIEEHNSMYIHIFKEKLKPKHHFLLFYPDIFKNGPPYPISCMRFGAKHKELFFSKGISYKGPLSD